MTESAAKKVFIAASVIVVLAIALAAILLQPSQPPPARAPSRPGARVIVETPRVLAKPSPRPARSVGNVDTEVSQPGLHAAHKGLLASRPLEQHLPYRDHEIGVDLVDVTSSGKLVLEVTYIHSRAIAKRHLEMLMARYHDPGSAYVIRYQPVFK